MQRSITHGLAASIGCVLHTGSPANRPRFRSFVVLIALTLAGCLTAARAGAAESCAAAVRALPATEQRLRVHGQGTAEWTVAARPGHEYLVEVTESGNDASVEVLRGAASIARADHPVRRTGTRRAIVASESATTLLVRVTGKEYPEALGTATVRVADLATLATEAKCLGVIRALAQGDADYADGELINHARASAQGLDARHSFLRAFESYLAAESALASPADQALKGEVALAIAALEYQDLSDWTKADEWGKTAADLLEPVDPYRHARAQALQVGAWIELGNSPSSPSRLARTAELAESLRAFHARRNEAYEAATEHNDAGIAELYSGHFHACIRIFRESVKGFAALGDTPRTAQSLQNEAICHWGLGDMASTLAAFNEALRKQTPDVFPKAYLATLNNSALANYALGNFDESLKVYDRSLALSRKVQSPHDEGAALYGIGVTYYALGDRQQAQQFLRRSLRIRSVEFDARGRMSTLRALANIDAEQGQVEEALAADREALALAVAQSAKARIRIQTAIHTALAGRRDEAAAEFDALLVPGEVQDSLLRAEARVQRAVLRREAGQPEKALIDLAEARPRVAESGNVAELFTVELETARSLRALGRAEEALAAVDRALAKSDALRVQSVNPELRAQLQAPLRPGFDLKLELLWTAFDRATRTGNAAEAGRLAALAFDSADASRARTFADVAAQAFTPELRRELAPLFKRREELYREIATRRYALTAREDRVGADDPGSKPIREEIAGLVREVDIVNTAIAAKGHATGGTAAPGAARLARLQGELSSGTALIAYWVGAESTFAWTASGTGLRWIRLGTPAPVNDAARAFHDSLTRIIDRPAERRLREGAALYELILRPLEADLATYREWIVVPDGVLGYIPFAALRVHRAGGDAFVAADHDITLTPAAWMLRPAAPARRGAPRELLMVADSVYEASDPRLGGRARPDPGGEGGGSRNGTPPNLSRLPGTAREAANIAALLPLGSVDRLTGLDAARERVLGLDWSRYRFIHMAVHGAVDAEFPELSALILSTFDSAGRPIEGAIRVADLSLKTLDADVAVFSACETALGKNVTSEGLVGIGYTTLARGARAVVASLWAVPDEIGAGLMTEFYRHLLRDSMSPSQALGTAMRSVLARDPAADPALWAPFQVSAVTLAAGPESRPALTRH